MTFFKEGDEGERIAKEEEEERQKNQTRRFWLAPDTSAEFTFIDTQGVYFWEHDLVINGQPGNYETCLKNVDRDMECPLCIHGKYPAYKICMFTIIDHREFPSKVTGNKVTNTKKIFAVKPTARDRIIREKSKRENNLIGCRYETFRSKKKESKTGEVFTFIKRATKEEILTYCPSDVDPKEFFEPFNYKELFAPKTEEALRKLIKMAAPVGADDEPWTGGETAKDEEKELFASTPDAAEVKSLKDLL